MTYSKDIHYWTQLRSALTGGLWSSAEPGKTPSGSPISWSELLRKFNKHCRGFQDIAEIASQTQALALLLSAKSGDEDQDGVEDTPYGSLDIVDECMLQEERKEEALVGYKHLRKLECTTLDSLNFALAYYAYALGHFADCLFYVSKIPNLSDIQSHIPAPTPTHSNHSSLAASSVTHLSTSWGSSFVSDGSAAIPEIKDGRAWSMVEIIRSICLQGMAHEKLSPDDPKLALASYRKALPLLLTAEFEIAAVPPSTVPPISSGVGKLAFHSFTRFRELWRWAERLIWRAVVLTSKICNVNDDAQEDNVWVWFSYYTACSAHWPANFRTQHRSVVCVLYLQALVLCARSGLVATPSTPRSSTPTPSTHREKRQPHWVQTARSVVQEYRAILTVSTRFPRAGERNVKVENFVDLCVAVWEASGEVGDHANWVIDILWWATRLTFNSHRIFRHMTRLLYVSGDTELAKRTLRLYVQIVGKAHSIGSDPYEVDTDRCWVETLVQGARMLCRFAMTTQGLDGIKYGREAGELVQKARTRLDAEDKPLAASVDLAEGVWSTVMALREHEPRTRPGRLAHAHAMFQRSVETFPTPAGHYHLALSLARTGPARDQERAITHLQTAIEGSPGEIRYWHALGLLLAATEQWSAARGALEQGAEISDADLAGDNSATRRQSQGGMSLRVKDFVFGDTASVKTVLVNGDGGVCVTDGGDKGDEDAGTDSGTAAMRECLVDASGAIAPGSTLLRPLLDHPRLSRHEILEHALQLRMTQAAVTEHMDGTEGATEKWVEVFAWVAEQRDRMSLSTSGSAEEPKTPTEMPAALHDVEHAHTHGHHAHTHSPASLAHHSSMIDLSLAVDGLPPIHIIPASPNGYSPREASFDKLSPITESSPAPSSWEKEREREKGGSVGTLGNGVGGDTSKGKKMQMLKNQVHKGQVRISTISRKIGHGVVRGSLRRSNSAPDFHSILRATNYQASSIHSRKRLSSFMYQSNGSRTTTDSPPPPPPATPVPPMQMTKGNSRSARENRLLSDLWLMSAATFRRSGKIEQAKGSIQEAEVRDEGNPGVWVQLGLYYMALGHEHHAIDTFHKALFIAPDDVPATVHLCRLYLSSAQKMRAGQGRLAASCTSTNGSGMERERSREEARSREAADNVDLAAGLLAPLTRGAGWDVPEAWYFLAKAYGVQGRAERARECLGYALTLSEGRGVREIGAAVGWFL